MFVKVYCGQKTKTGFMDEGYLKHAWGMNASQDGVHLQKWLLYKQALFHTAGLTTALMLHICAMSCNRASCGCSGRSQSTSRTIMCNAGSPTEFLLSRWCHQAA